MKKFRPTTPTLRHTVLSDRSLLTRVKGKKQQVKPEKSLLEKKKSTGGRNNLGRMTSRHRGGGHRKHYRIIDFKRDKLEIPGTVSSIEYDPNRTAYIALVVYKDGEKRYIIAPQGLEVGHQVITTDRPPYRIGNCMKLKDMPLGATIHNIELTPGRGGQVVRSAGNSAQLLGVNSGKATIKLPSGETRLFNENCRATIGSLSNAEHLLRKDGKAGRSRWKGRRPHVRGVAMNPVDHPHGGGEGKSKGGNIPQSPWGTFAKGFKTRSKRKSTNHVVQPRRRK